MYSFLEMYVSGSRHGTHIFNSIGISITYWLRFRAAWGSRGRPLHGCTNEDAILSLELCLRGCNVRWVGPLHRQARLQCNDKYYQQMYQVISVRCAPDSVEKCCSYDVMECKQRCCPQQRFLATYLLPGRVGRRVRFGLGELVPLVPAFSFPE